MMGKSRSGITFFMVFLVAVGILAVSEEGAAKKKVKWVKSKGGLKALIALSKSNKKMARILKDETENYDKTVKAIGRETLKAGDPASEVKNLVGEPVLIMEGADPGAVEWLYKPSNVTFFFQRKGLSYF